MSTSNASILRLDSRSITLGHLRREIEGARRAIIRRKAPEILQTARNLLRMLEGAEVQLELAHAAVAFADGTEERPGAEDWVFLAVAARAVLDRAEKSGASAIARQLEQLDEALDDTREAVLLLEPEDYKEALAATPPNTRAWWGERARLDEGLLEISLERALGDLADR